MSSVAAPPSVLGRYELGALLGGGPTGSVYRARLAGVAGFAKEYALKVFHPELTGDAHARRQLTAGLRAAVPLTHPRIARLHEHLDVGGWIVGASELVPGVDLARLIALTVGVGRPLPPGAMLFVITQVARTLGYAHGRNVAHLGLCPTNVLALPDGDLKLTDFAILPARLGDSPAEDETLASRLPYLSPEQLVGARAAPTVDVFELGVLAYELFTGERAFGGDVRVEIAARIMAGSPEDAPIPPAVRDVLRKALSPRPEERFADGAAMAGALDAVALRAALPGGRGDVAAAVKRLIEEERATAAAQGFTTATSARPSPPRATPPRAPSEPSAVTSVVTPPRGSGPSDLPTAGPAAPTVPGGTPAFVVGGADERPSDDLSGLLEVPLDLHVAAPGTLRGVGTPGGTSPGVRTRSASEPSFEDGLSPEDLETYRGELLELTPPPRGSDDATRDPAPPRARTLPPALPDVDSNPPIDLFAPDAPPLGSEAPRARPRPAEVSDVLGAATGPAYDAHDLAALDADGDSDSDGDGDGDGDGDALDTDDGRSSGRARALVGLLVVAIGGLAAAYVLKPELLPLEWVGLGTPAPEAPVRPVAFAIDAAAEVALAGTADAGTATTTTATGPDAAVAATPGGAIDAPLAARVELPDAAPVAVATPPDAPVAPVVATTAPLPTPAAPGASDSVATVTAGGGPLQVTSVPSGAAVYLDGALKGKTPVELPASGDRHKLAVIKAGHAPYKADVDGSGKVAITLAPPAVMRGPAGVKVACRTRNRLYVYVDGQPTGRLCPTERIHVSLGTHTVELYDPVTDATSTHQVDVKDTHFSVKVKVPD